MRIESPAIHHAEGKVFVSSDILRQGERKTLWFSVPEKYAANLLPDRGDAFLVALLPQAMLLGEDIEVDAELSEKLLYNVQNYYVPLFRKIVPKLSAISISAMRGTTRRFASSGLGAATGFSGGIDSFCAIAEHYGDKALPSYRLSTLLFNNVGAVPSHRFAEKYRQMAPATAALGIDLIPIDSNLDEFIDLTFQLTHTMRNVACALLLQGLYDKYLYASTYSYQDTHVSPTYDVAYIDPLALPLLSTESLDVVATGGQHTRIEKTRIVSEFEASHQWLNVCAAANRIDNCSVCWKCGRTLLTLELLGRMEAFSQVFDLEKWGRARRWYIAEFVLNPKKRGDPLAAEIRELAHAVGHRFSATEQVMATLIAYSPQAVVNRLKGN